MRKPVRIALRIVGGLVGLVLLVVIVTSAMSEMRQRKRYDVAGKAVAIPSDSASIVRGKTFATLAGCTACHTPTLAGHTMIDQFPMARLASANLTRGAGGIAATYADEDWDRAVRHGLKRDGTPVFIMPAHEYNRMSDDELGRIIAYVKSVPPVDRTPVARRIYPLGRALHVFGEPVVPAERIDHSRQVNPQPPPGATLAYGEYVGSACQMCHGADLGGRKVGGEPGAPPSPPIGPASVVARWTEAQFFQTMRTGVTPEGRTLRPQYMPWPEIGHLRDEELRALHMYLKQPVLQTEKAGT